MTTDHSSSPLPLRGRDEKFLNVSRNIETWAEVPTYVSRDFDLCFAYVPHSNLKVKYKVNGNCHVMAILATVRLNLTL